MTLAACDSSIETLSKDLEDRINKIKQKYYQKSTQENYQPERVEVGLGRNSLEGSKAVEKRLEGSRGSFDYRDGRVSLDYRGGGAGFERSRISFGER